MGTAQDANAFAAAQQGAPGRGFIDARRQGRHHNAAGRSDLIGQPAAHFQAVGRGAAGTDDGNGSLLIQALDAALDKQGHRRGKNGLQPGRISRVLHGDHIQTQGMAGGEDGVHPAQVPGLQKGSVPLRQAGKARKSAGGGKEGLLRAAVVGDQRRPGSGAYIALGGKPQPVFYRCQCSTCFICLSYRGSFPTE